MTTTPTTPEDQGQAPEDRVDALYARYLQHPGRTVQHLIVRGQCLLEIKELLRGTFCAWRTARGLGWSTSHNAMQVAREFGPLTDITPLQDLRLRDLYDLSRADLDAPEVRQFLAALIQGLAISERAVVECVCDYLTERGFTFAREVRTSGGDIDILTDTLIIECKGLLSPRALREAQRQLRDYQRALPGERRPIIIGLVYPARDTSAQVADIRSLGIDVVVLSGLMDEDDLGRLELGLGLGTTPPRHEEA